MFSGESSDKGTFGVGKLLEVDSDNHHYFCGRSAKYCDMRWYEAFWELYSRSNVIFTPKKI
jgi:hypothetical protein